jgi:hypothetical protein
VDRKLIGRKFVLFILFFFSVFKIFSFWGKDFGETGPDGKCWVIYRYTHVDKIFLVGGIMNGYVN